MILHKFQAELPLLANTSQKLSATVLGLQMLQATDPDLAGATRQSKRYVTVQDAVFQATGPDLAGKRMKLLEDGLTPDVSSHRPRPGRRNGLHR